MTPIIELELAAVSFVGSHFLLSHPLRGPLVRAVGEKAFLLLYSIVAFATLGWMIWAARAVPPETPYWVAGSVWTLIAGLLVWLASILLVGSFVGNPAFPDPTGRTPTIRQPHGVFRITRHPMMWAFGLWAIAHAIVNATPAGLVISEAIGILAVVGAAFQDRKKQQLMGSAWRDWERQTSFLPFGKGFALPGWFAFVAGTVLFLAATWAHGALGYREAGIWAYFA